MKKKSTVSKVFLDNGKKECKTYQEYNPEYNPEATFTTFGRKEVLSQTESNKLKDKLNDILKRKPAVEWKKYI